jgi:hypothetical protein
MSSDTFLRSLAEIRDGNVSARNTSGGGALVKEAHALCAAVRNGAAPTDLRQLTESGSIFRKASFGSRRRNFNSLRHRYLDGCPKWVLPSLAQASSHGVQSPEFVSLAYLYFALRDRLVFDFVTDPLWEKWNQKVTSVTTEDFLAFMSVESDKFGDVKQWREQTRHKLAQNALTSLRDFGVLNGARTKHIQKPLVADETVFHLLCILTAEGKRGSDLIDAPDWRLFLWSEAEVVLVLGRLAQKGWIRFEKSGRTVEFGLARKPEVSP